MNSYNLGIDIGGTKCSVVLGSAEHADRPPEAIILNKITFPTEVKNGPQHTLNNLFEAIDTISAKNGTLPGQIRSIGISCGSPLDLANGLILNPPNLYGWNNVPIVDMVSQKYGIPARLQNDANACALAEWRFGAARGYRSSIFITMGTGLGAGLILDNRLYSGANGMAGEIGHVRLSENGPVGYGKEGSFEGFCSGGGIAQVARSLVLEKLQKGESVSFCDDFSRLETITTRTVAEAARNNDPVALAVFRKTGRYLGKGLSILIDILNPEIIVIGSIYERNEHLLRGEVESVIQTECLAHNRNGCKVVPSQLGDNIGAIAPLTVAEYIGQQSPPPGQGTIRTHRYSQSRDDRNRQHL